MIIPYESFTSSFDSFGRKIIEVSEARFRNLVADQISKITVDERWYLYYYKDVQNAVNFGHIKSAKDHYISYGYYENRLPRWAVVDDAWYLDFYPDVRDAIESRKISSPQTHFLSDGFREGRLPSAFWSLAEG